MATYDEAKEAVSEGFIAKREAWEDDQAIVLALFGNKFGFPVYINDGRLHDQTGFIKRYYANSDDKAATDWVWQKAQYSLEDTVSPNLLN
jgi:hypothetical protein